MTANAAPAVKGEGTGEAPSRLGVVEDVIAEAAARLSNWGGWGPDDRCGTLNLIDEAKRIEAASLVQRGVTYCASNGIYEFQLVAPPLPFTGAVGPPLNPIAIK